MLKNPKYKTSNYIVVTSGAKYYQIQHLITRKKIGVTQKIVAIIKSFNKEQTIEDGFTINNKDNSLNKDAYYEKIDFLIKKKIIVLNDGEEELAQSLDYNLFGIED